MQNAMTIDLEDWFCVNSLGIKLADWDKQELRVTTSTRRLLDLLQKHNTYATFFALGWIVERVPELMREIERRGHEIGTHGYSHTMLTLQTPEGFAADLVKALEVTRACIRQPVLGFRAPNFSLNRESEWALGILARHGIKYDSSVVPIGYHSDTRITDASLGIHTLGALIEVPLSSLEILGARIPCGGGIFFRAFPYVVTRALLQRCYLQGRAVVFYLHPWEIDPGHPRVRSSLAGTFRHYFNLDKTLERLDQLLSDFEFTSVKRVLGL